jgi:predicted transcriptional regulator
MTLISPQECKDARRRLGVPQTALCELSELRSNYICRFEGGKIREPSGRKLVAIIDALRAFEAVKSKHQTASTRELLEAAKKELLSIHVQDKKSPRKTIGRSHLNRLSGATL